MCAGFTVRAIDSLGDSLISLSFSQRHQGFVQVFLAGDGIGFPMAEFCPLINGSRALFDASLQDAFVHVDSSLLCIEADFQGKIDVLELDV
ncbi:hypothetical protein A1A1_04777 [Planococcus antarcticus DSM 14505]|uniref:Uncharacterized protein n=1 Tax=Planococcus antarcticus DSM 14505 TaxID=1185653 RepID=A0A1C7DCR7_9BACL|nr:hypothetical protein BBH88_02185 [Planococcus antarcticus DSM 14505]EIM07743.1 hypothetical protein A1A1_04777 [Planococcus antarcticus DSM 14505]